MQSRLSIITSSLWGILVILIFPPRPALLLSKLLFSLSRLFKPYSRLCSHTSFSVRLSVPLQSILVLCSTFKQTKIRILCFGGKSTFLWTRWNDSSSRDQLAQRAGHFQRGRSFTARKKTIIGRIRLYLNRIQIVTLSLLFISIKTLI